MNDLQSRMVGRMSRLDRHEKMKGHIFNDLSERIPRTRIIRMPETRLFKHFVWSFRYHHEEN